MKKSEMNVKTHLFVICFCFIALIVSCTKSDDNSGDQNLKVSDASGNVYNTVTVGTQIWTTESLTTTKLNNGSSIYSMSINEYATKIALGQYSDLDKPWYITDESGGKLYNIQTVNTGQLCPTGWHVPSKQEWTTLIDFLGGTAVAGGKLKETGTSHWIAPNTGASNEIGFTALPNAEGKSVATFLTSSGERVHLSSNSSIVTFSSGGSSFTTGAIRCMKLK